MQLIKWVHEPLWIAKVKVIHWPWSKVTQIQHFFSLETARPTEDKFHMKSPWDGGMKIYSNDPGHMTSMAAMPICGKNLKKSNWKANDLKCWYVASGTQVLPNLFKWWPWIDLDLFYGKVKFVPLCFCMGKK